MNRENAMRTGFLAASLLMVSVTSAVAQGANTIHLCLVPPSTQVPDASSTDAAAAVRDAFTHYLTGPSVDVEMLTAPLVSQAREEAKQKQCRYILYATATQQRKKSSGLLGRVAATAVQSGASQVASSTGSTAARVVARATADGAGHMYDQTSFTRSNDVLTLTVRLESADGKALSDNTEKRTASSDREDLLTPLVERAAERIMNAANGATP
jgi:hypothetical protein